VAGLKASFKFCETALAQVQDAQLGDSIASSAAARSRRPRGVDYRGRLGGPLQPDAIYLRLNGLLPPTAKKGMD